MQPAHLTTTKREVEWMGNGPRATAVVSSSTHRAHEDQSRPGDTIIVYSHGWLYVRRVY